MSPLASYRHLLALAGPRFVLVAFLGRLPLAMSQMGTLLLVSATTGSYGAGGAAAGALAVANAVGSPVAGALADRHGQRPVVLVQSVLGAAGLAALVVVADAGAGAAPLVVTAAATGLVLPQVGPLARVRWRPITERAPEHRSRLLDTAFSYEGAADEASFVLGPALLGVLVAVADPRAGLVLAAGTLAVFGVAFALHPTARMTRHGSSAHVTAVPLVTSTFVVLCAAQLLIGMVFGSVQTGTTALTTAAGEPGLAGLVHASLGVGSVVAGLAVAALPAGFAVPDRLAVAAGGMALLAAPLLLVGTVPALFAVVLLLGFVVAPYLISVFVLGERTAPPTRTGAAMTLLAGATGIGYALGSGVAGRLADQAGHPGAFAVTVAAAGVAGLLAASVRGHLRSAAPGGPAFDTP